MKNKFVLKSNSGISLVTVIITIIVIIILAAISIRGLTTTQDAAYSKYVQEFEELSKGVETKRLTNSKYGVENADNGFHQVYVSGEIPYNFMSIDNGGEQIAYLVSLDYIGYDDLSTGRDYKRFEALAGEDIKTVKFGVDDVYVYDSTGKLFYAKGFVNGDEIVHDADQDSGYIQIVDVEKELNAERTEVKVTITIESKNEIDSVRVKNDDFNEKATQIDDGVYEIIIDKNDNYEIIAEDKEDNQDKENLVITGIGSLHAPTVTATVTNGVLEGEYYKIKETTAKIEITSSTAKYLYIGKTNTMPDTDVWLPFANNVERYFTDAGEKILYVWVKDENGNICENPCELKILVELESVEIQTPTLENVSGGIIFDVEPDVGTWSKSKKVKIIFSGDRQSGGYTSEFNINGGRWTQSYASEATLDIATNNTTVNARITYISDYQNELVTQNSVTVGEIDREPPTINYFRVDSTGKYLEAEGYEPTDSDGNGIRDKAGLHSQPYLITTEYLNFKYLTDEQIDGYAWEATNTLKITQDTKYYLYVRDAVNNIATASLNAEAPDETPPVIKEITATSILDYAVIKTIAQDDTGIVAYGLTKENSTTPPPESEWTQISEEEYVVIEHNDIREDGIYTVWVKDYAQNIASGEATVKLFQFPVLDDAYPKSLYVKEDSAVSMEIKIVTPGYPDEYEFQWQVSSDSGETWTSIGGATEMKYDFTALYEYNNNLYKCVINHARGVMESNIAKLESIRITKDKPKTDIEQESELVLGGVIINKGATTTYSTTLTIDVYALNAAEMCISEDGTKGEWMNYKESTSYTLSNTTNGTKTITVWVRDREGNEASSSVSSQITLLETV